MPDIDPFHFIWWLLHQWHFWVICFCSSLLLHMLVWMQENKDDIR